MSSDDSLVELTIGPEDQAEFKRLDLYLTTKIPEHSRSFIKGLFEMGQIVGYYKDAPFKLELKRLPPLGTRILVSVPPPLPLDAPAQDIPLKILYEDEELLVIDKPAGLVVHPGAGNPDGTLVNAVLFHCKDLRGIGHRFRPGIVHRLDKGTSGVMVVAKAQKCHEELVLLFSKHDIERRYMALAMGPDMVAGGVLKSLIGRHPTNRLKMAANVRSGREAETHFRVLEKFEKCSLVELTLKTGRTHQIRVHLSELLRHPILNDSLYANPPEHLRRLGPQFVSLVEGYPHPFLHAKVLGFMHPIRKIPMRFEIDPPEMFQKVLEALRSKS